MTDATDRTAEIAAYQLAVERHLSDLPEHIRDDLLSGLDAHLAEVAADLEPGVGLHDLLGGPEAYARELRETVDVTRESRTRRIRKSVRTRLEPAVQGTKRAAEKFAASAGVGEIDGFWRNLTPAWWILRGVLAAMVFFALFVGELRQMSIGSPAAVIIIGTVTLAFVWLSLRIGVRTGGWSLRRRRVVAASGALLVAIALINASAVWDRYRWSGPHSPVHYEDIDRWRHVQDVYVYDANGELVEGAYLFDQDGDPIELGDPEACPDWNGSDSFAEEPGVPAETLPDHLLDQYGHRYPLCEARERSDQDPTPENEPMTEGPSPEEPTAESTAEEMPSPEEPTEETTTAEAPTSEAPTEPTEGE